MQLAPGVVDNRPQSGHPPLRQNLLSSNGFTQFVKDTWYEGLEMNGNTSINPFFYGTYLAETKPNEPVSRSKEEAFQADAVGTYFFCVLVITILAFGHLVWMFCFAVLSLLNLICFLFCYHS
jgi:hypothetical protein